MSQPSPAIVEANPHDPASLFPETQQIIEVVDAAKDYDQKEQSSWFKLRGLSKKQYSEILQVVVQDEGLMAPVRDKIKLYCDSRTMSVSVCTRSLLHRLFVDKINHEITEWLKEEGKKLDPAGSFARDVQRGHAVTVGPGGMPHVYQHDLSFWHKDAEKYCVVLEMCGSLIHSKPSNAVEAMVEGDDPEAQVGIQIDISKRASAASVDAELKVWTSELDTDGKSRTSCNINWRDIHKWTHTDTSSGIDLKLSDFGRGTVADDLIRGKYDSEFSLSLKDLYKLLRDAEKDAGNLAAGRRG